MEQIW